MEPTPPSHGVLFKWYLIIIIKKTIKKRIHKIISSASSDCLMEIPEKKEKQWLLYCSTNLKYIFVVFSLCKILTTTLDGLKGSNYVL